MTDEPGIFRLVRVRVTPGREAEFAELMETQFIPARKGFPGMRNIFRMRTTGSDGVTEYAFATIWNSRADLDHFEAATKGLPPNDTDLIEHRTVVVYELIAIDDYDV